MSPIARTNSEKVLTDLVHDLRQPLGTLEYSACYLEMLLPEAQETVQRQLRIIQQQLDVATRLVSHAVAQVSDPDCQRRGAAESLDLTKSETASVT